MLVAAAGLWIFKSSTPAARQSASSRGWLIHATRPAYKWKLYQNLSYYAHSPDRLMLEPLPGVRLQARITIRELKPFL